MLNLEWVDFDRKGLWSERKKEGENISVGFDGIIRDPLDTGEVMIEELMNACREFHITSSWDLEKSIKPCTSLGSETLRYAPVYWNLACPMYVARTGRACWGDFPRFFMPFKVLMANECLKLWGLGAPKVISPKIFLCRSRPISLRAFWKTGQMWYLVTHLYQLPHTKRPN